MTQASIAFGHNVRVRDTPLTRGSLANLTGMVFGYTTPSMKRVEVIGELLSDYAIAVHFKHFAEPLWFAPELLEFIDHGAGTLITVGTKKLRRQADGSWLKEKSDSSRSEAEAHLDDRARKKPSRPWWKFW